MWFSAAEFGWWLRETGRCGGVEKYVLLREYRFEKSRGVHFLPKGLRRLPLSSRANLKFPMCVSCTVTYNYCA